MFLLLVLLIGVSSALDIREIVFVISSQENEFNLKLAKNLKDDIIFQSRIVFETSPVVHLSHQDFPHFAEWTILPIVPDILELHKNNASWIFFLQDYTVLKVHKIVEILDRYNHCEEVLVGHALNDEQSTIIHHFGFHDDPKSFKYPNLATGFAMTIPVLSRIAKQWEENEVYLSNFSIDIAYELAKYIWKNGCKGAMVRHEPSFCNEYSPHCATFPNRLHICDNIMPRNNIFFAVKTCKKFHHNRVPIVQKTWGRHAPLIKYFSDEEDTSIPTTNLGVPNTENGHCAKTVAIMRHISKEIEKNGTDIKWIVIADDDTILGVTKLQNVLSCYDHNQKIAIGERYAYEIHEPFGYNYITGGGGMVFSRPLLQELGNQCKCPSISSPDDMYLGFCMSKLGVKVTNVPGFHQARPEDYPAGYLKTHEAISFHKHWMIDPMKVYHEWLSGDLLKTKQDDTFRLLLQEIMLKTLDPYKCVVILKDQLHSSIFGEKWFETFRTAISFVMINVDEAEDLYSPSTEIQNSLLLSKTKGCQLYIILIANGIQVTRLLQFGDRYRALDTMSKYILFYDNRLLDKKLFYLWRRIINVIFIKRHSGKKLSGNDLSWFEIMTVPFPVPINAILIPWRVDIWAHSKFRKGAELFRDKTSDLQNQTLRVVVLAHLPGVTKINTTSLNDVRALLGNNGDNETVTYHGVEVEILQAVSKAMNFRCEVYEAENSDTELWGRKLAGGFYTGVIGEMVSARADIALGDLYYTSYILDLMDLSVPFNTECLTFLTPESLTDDSWKTLILPFSPIMWASVVMSLLFCIVAFHYLARFHVHITKIENELNKVIHPEVINNKLPRKKEVITLYLYPELGRLDQNIKFAKMNENYQKPKEEENPEGLYQFSEPINSALYTYSMLLLVSIPKLPTGWSLRMLTGWHWLYCLLVVTSYRASMTAILARPAPKVKIDTLQELAASKLTCGGWGEINSDFFESLNDPDLKMLSRNFVLVNDSEEAVNRVAEASFAFYENTYFLKGALVKRQQRLRLQLSQHNSSKANGNQNGDSTSGKRILHIMNDCIINMPISIGLQKNSPIKPRMDKYIRRILEAGFVKKWLDDVMLKVLNAEIQTENVDNLKALMNMKKFSGALVILLIGYFISIMTFIAELIHFQWVVMKNPYFNKYSRRIEKF